ncbi:MAG TPA: cupin domain-containing protein, partial [Bacteroidia bacterium]|nr:cupin domain-containing protein [Bacteroidia bacterium]
MKTAAYWIEKLGLTQHVEGGAFKETYRSPLVLSNLPRDFKGARNASTTIYFLLQDGEFSALHKIAADEGWHFYEGTPLTVYEIEANGNLIKHTLGRDFEKGETFQCTIKAGSWFGSRVENGGYALVGCTVAPGFDFADFELANRDVLLQQFSHHEKLI